MSSRCDSNYKILKSNYAETVSFAENSGFKLVSFKYGQKMFYLVPRLCIILDKIFGERSMKYS